MPKAIMFVETSPSSPDREDEYNEWYSKIHLEDLLAIPGVNAARRFRASDVTPRAPGAHTYCAVYEIDADDLGAVMGEIGARAGDGRMRMSDALSMDPPPAMTLYELVD
jgi:hypothetical protein